MVQSALCLSITTFSTRAWTPCKNWPSATHTHTHTHTPALVPSYLNTCILWRLRDFRSLSWQYLILRSWKCLQMKVKIIQLLAKICNITMNIFYVKTSGIHLETIQWFVNKSRVNKTMGWWIPCYRDLLHSLIVIHLVNKFAFICNLNVLLFFTEAKPSDINLYHSNPVPIFTPYFSKIFFNTTVPSMQRKCDSSVSCGLGNRGSIPGRDFSFLHRVHTCCGAHPATYPMGTEGSFPEVKWPRREGCHSIPPSAEVKNAWSYTSSATCVFKAWCSVKNRGKFTTYT
jgi:hypothetical protein